MFLLLKSVIRFEPREQASDPTSLLNVIQTESVRGFGEKGRARPHQSGLCEKPQWDSRGDAEHVVTGEYRGTF